MRFKPYHYPHIDEFMRYYAKKLGNEVVIKILNKGIEDERDAKIFCDFIPLMLDARLADERAGVRTPVEIGSGVISDLHYEAASFVCDAGYEPIWDAMIEDL